MTPQALLEQPNMDYETRFYLNTFYRLSMSRQIGMSVSYIPVSEIIIYGNNIVHLEESIEDFVYIIQAVDAKYVKEANKKK